jgi:hypothetical protein
MWAYLYPEKYVVSRVLSRFIPGGISDCERIHGSRRNEREQPRVSVASPGLDDDEC